MEITVHKISNDAELNAAWAIRKQVFVVEQNVGEEEEFEYEQESVHFIALNDNLPIGTARWRKTENGIKLERFAILEAYRSLGVGSALLQAIILDLPKSESTIYLHAQLTAMGLYAKFGFKPIGPQFEEANIQHFKMQLG